jgi:chromosome segregation ATPase
LGATEPPDRPAGAGSWSRGRGIVSAVVAILVVALALFLSRLDLANELSVVRSQLTAANQEVAESEAELDQLQEEARAASQTITACREAAELSEQVRAAFQTLRKGLETGDEGTIAQGVAGILEIESRWTQANAQCLEAAGSADQS